MLAFEDRMGWNVYQYCLKRNKPATVTLNESKDHKSAQMDQNIIGTLNQHEWIFVFERVGALTAKGKAVINNVGDIFSATVYALKHKEESVEAVYTLDLRYLCISM